ncbi:MAG: PqqD family protein [Sphingomonas sp.]|uniref:PqqD family protein n=1 Tax=Sphingomonas sp. TaxID=28214 RepID=UPI002276DE68|nr:PqqD family protein [Sphingomonas sp.]MCX8477811.1 PqqD family protein [Sphingomonas sp.]
MPDDNPDDVIVARGGSLMEAQTGHEMVGLQIESGVCFGFNRTAYRIWQLVEQPISLERLCRVLSDEFAVDPSVCLLDVHALIDELARDGLVILSCRS